jgi:hypothetical protein
VGRLSGIDTVLLDLDGTLYVGSRVVAGAPEAVRRNDQICMDDCRARGLVLVVGPAGGIRMVD